MNLPSGNVTCFPWISTCGRRAARLLVLIVVVSTSGCAALSFPVEGIPVHRIPMEILGPSRDASRPIDLSRLGQPKPAIYRLGPGDIIGVWIPGILPGEDASPPVHFGASGGADASLGYPVEVQDDGTLALPQIAPVRVAGMTLAEAKEQIRLAYVDAARIQPEFDRLFVSLVRKRAYRVVVMREDAGVAITIEDNEIKQKPKQGTGHVVELPAYENDVLHALARTGGLPGTDAIARVIIERNTRSLFSEDPRVAPVSVIPLRAAPNLMVPFEQQDVILYDGDVVYLEPREDEYFYTGGLLPGGQFELPRDRDVDVVEALSIVRGTIANGGIQTNIVFQRSFIDDGLGGPSPSLVIVLRRLPNGGQLPIRVNLNEALRDPRQRINIKPGDTILLQQTVGESVARYFARQLQLFTGSTLWSRSDSLGRLNFASGPALP